MFLVSLCDARRQIRRSTSQRSTSSRCYRRICGGTTATTVPSPRRPATRASPGRSSTSGSKSQRLRSNTQFHIMKLLKPRQGLSQAEVFFRIKSPFRTSVTRWTNLPLFPQLLKMETTLYSSKAADADKMLLQDNFRSTQPLNHRVVLASFSAGKTDTRGRRRRSNIHICLQLV